MVMLANYGELSLAEVLEPAMQMAKGYPIEAAQADNMERHRETIAQWPASKRILLPHWEDGSGERAAAVPRDVSPKSFGRMGVGSGDAAGTGEGALPPILSAGWSFQMAIAVLPEGQDC